MGDSVKNLHDILEEAEKQIQTFLVGRPPAFFVQRKLNLMNIPEDKRLALLRDILPTVDDPNTLAYSTLADSLSLTQRDDVACLNRYFYSDLREMLEEIVSQVRSLLYKAREGSDEFLIYGCTELLGYLLVEQCYWEFITQPLVVLRFDNATMTEAGDLLESAHHWAREHRDWLRWHRIVANQARLGYLARDQSDELSRTFDAAISLGQLCLDHGYSVDRAFLSRRDELLHMAGVVKFARKELTYPDLCAHIKSPARIKPQPGTVRLTIESGSLIANMSIPLVMATGEQIRRSSEHTAYIDWLSLEDRIQVWMTYKGGIEGYTFSYRDLHDLDNLDLIFRPNQFDVTLSVMDEPFGSRKELKDEEAASMGGNGTSTEHIAFLGHGFFRDDNLLGSDVVEGMRWLFRFPVVEVGLDENGHPYHMEYTPDLVGIPWERSLGTVLCRILPDDKDLKHVVISSDGPLALLPFHLALLPDGQLLNDRYKVSYAPSLAYFSSVPEAFPKRHTRVAVMINSRNRLQGPIWELQRMKGRLPDEAIQVLDGYEGDLESLQTRLADSDIVHIATHGHTFTDKPEESGIELKHGRILTIKSIETLTLKPGCLVFLNACGSNRVTIRSRIQFSSIANAFLAAGASTVIATFWETDDVAAALISDRFYTLLLEEGRGRLESLDLAIGWLKDLNLDQLHESDLGALAFFLPLERMQPYRNLLYRGQFALFGHW